MVAEVVGEAALAEAIVVTDSLTDAPLLAAVKTPCLVQWPEAQYVPAMEDFYAPLRALFSKKKADL